MSIFDESRYVHLYNAMGEEVLIQNIRTDNFSLDVSALKPGMYIAAISKRGIVLHTQKFIKE